MNLPLYAHHIFLHAPIVLAPILAIIGTYWFFEKNDERRHPLEQLLRYIGDSAALLTAIVVTSGFFIDFATLNPVYSPFLYRDHYYLGVTTLVTTVVAAASVEWGLRYAQPRVAHFGALMWWTVSLSALATGHYGGTMSLAY